jgi:hypothetical protein
VWISNRREFKCGEDLYPNYFEFKAKVVAKCGYQIEETPSWECLIM